MATNRYFALNSWSAFTLNLPFSKLAIVVGDPVRVPADADATMIEQARLALQSALDTVHARAYELVGSRDPGASLRNGGPQELAASGQTA